MKDFKPHVIRQKISHRGGGIEIDCTAFGYPNVKMTAYQNYLGGGMLGAIGNDCNKQGWQEDPELVKLSEDLARYFHSLTNHSDNEWETATFEENQRRPMSAY